MFADIKNQVIMEAREKREASPKTHNNQRLVSKKRSQGARIESKKTDIRVPILRSSMSMLNNSAILQRNGAAHENRQPLSQRQSTAPSASNDMH